MKLSALVAGIAVAVASQAAIAAQDPAEVNAVVDAVKAANPDLRALCKSGGVRNAVTEKTRELATAGKLKGDPQAVGAEAGQQIVQQCRA